MRGLTIVSDQDQVRVVPEKQDTHPEGSGRGLVLQIPTMPTKVV